jgi:hypothetical protein
VNRSTEIGCELSPKPAAGVTPITIPTRKTSELWFFFDIYNLWVRETVETDPNSRSDDIMLSEMKLLHFPNAAHIKLALFAVFQCYWCGQE